MQRGEKERHEVIMSGVGGRGVLTAGLFLAQAGMGEYQHVLWFPSYQAAKRGGPCECSVVLSNTQISSPVLSKVEALVVIEPSQLHPFLNRVRPGGLVVVEAHGLKKDGGRDDVELLEIPAVQIALQMGDSQASNFVLLGAYVGASGVLSPELLEKELESRYGGKERVLNMNREAFRKGLEIGESFQG